MLCLSPWLVEPPTLAPPAAAARTPFFFLGIVSPFIAGVSRGPGRCTSKGHSGTQHVSLSNFILPYMILYHLFEQGINMYDIYFFGLEAGVVLQDFLVLVMDFLRLGRIVFKGVNLLIMKDKRYYLRLII